MIDIVLFVLVFAATIQILVPIAIFLEEYLMSDTLWLIVYLVLCWILATIDVGILISIGVLTN